MSATFPQVATEEFVRTAFERCPTGLLVVNECGQITALNREIERQFGYTRDELLGQSVEMLEDPESAAEPARADGVACGRIDARRSAEGTWCYPAAIQAL